MKSKYSRQSIGKDRAIELGKSGWWKEKTPTEIATFQLFTDELCMPFDVFHGALEKALKRPVWTHDLALNYDGIMMELLGEKEAPTMREVLSLIPNAKLIVVVA